MKHTLFCKLRLLLPLMAAVMLSFQRLTAQTRIAVVSDIHVMAPSLLDNPDNTEWKKYYEGQRKMLQESANLFDQFVDQMKTSKPDILLITGDLTKDGEIASHDYVRNALAELTGNPYNIKVYVIPGNHDFGISTVYKYEATNQKTALSAEEKMADATAFKTFYENYGYGTGSTIDPGSISYVAEPVPGLVILGIDSHDASVGEETLNWLCSQASAATAAGKQVIAMMHHPLFPHITGANLFIDTYTVGNYETVRNKLIDAGVKYIFTGHFHTSDIAYDWNDDETNGIYDINTGSLISYPCDYRMLDLSADKKTLSLSTLSLNPSGSKEWLKERVKTITTDKMNAKAGAMASMFATQINNLASFAADLFILHAEGTENASADNRAGLVSTYSGYKKDFFYSKALSVGGINDATIYSILDDKSYYGETHENQTDDRWMDILSINDNGWGTYCTGRDLDISSTSGLTAYQVTGVNAGKATLTALTEVPASAGFLVNGEAGTYELKASYVAVEGLPDNMLTGTLNPTAAPANSYVMATKSSKTGFYPAGSTLTIPAHKAYLTYNGGSSVRMISLGDDDATGIDTMESVISDNESIFTLQGTKAGSLRSGLYIKNRKLIIIK